MRPVSDCERLAIQSSIGYWSVARMIRGFISVTRIRRDCTMFRKSFLTLVLMVLGLSGAAVALDEPGDDNCVLTEEVLPVYGNAPIEVFYGDVF